MTSQSIEEEHLWIMLIESVRIVTAVTNVSSWIQQHNVIPKKLSTMFITMRPRKNSSVPRIKRAVQKMFVHVTLNSSIRKWCLKNVLATDCDFQSHSTYVFY